MTRRLAAFVLALLWTSAAFAHPEYLWPTPATLTDSQMRRIDTLVARAQTHFPGLPADQRLYWAAGLAGELAELGLCRRAEQLLEGAVDPGMPLRSIAIAASAHPDRECADRFITRLAGPRWREEAAEVDPLRLYWAGALWRRIGEHEKGAQAIARAEAIYQAEEARDPDAAWRCHGGDCLSPLWFARLHTLRAYHGTPLHRLEMNWMASLAQSHRHAREANRPAPFIGRRVFDELLFHAITEGYEPLARSVAEDTVYRAASYPAFRMSFLLRQGRVAEALALWPAAGRAYPGRFEPALIRENPSAFHPLRERFRDWISYGDAPERLSVLPMAWIEAGDRARAGEALATAVADFEAHSDQWNPHHVGRIRAAQAQLESPGGPLAWLAARRPADAVTRDHAFAELAAGLVAVGRWQEARRALRHIASAEIRHDATVRLPCRAAAGGEAAALMAVRIAAPSLQPRVPTRDAISGFTGDSYQTFLCLFRHRQADAAVAYAAAVRDPERKLNLLVAMPLNGGVDDNFLLVAMPPTSRLAEELQVRRRFATFALEHVRRHGLWDRHAIPSLAADFERLGDFATVDRILRRVRSEDIKGRVYEALLRSYGRDRIRTGSTP